MWRAGAFEGSRRSAPDRSGRWAHSPTSPGPSPNRGSGRLGSLLVPAAGSARPRRAASDPRSRAPRTTGRRPTSARRSPPGPRRPAASAVGPPRVGAWRRHAVRSGPRRGRRSAAGSSMGSRAGSSPRGRPPRGGAECSRDAAEGSAGAVAPTLGGGPGACPAPFHVPEHPVTERSREPRGTERDAALSYGADVPRRRPFACVPRRSEST